MNEFVVLIFPAFLETYEAKRRIFELFARFLRPADTMVSTTTVHQREWQIPDNFDEHQAMRNANK